MTPAYEQSDERRTKKAMWSIFLGLLGVMFLSFVMIIVTMPHPAKLRTVYLRAPCSCPPMRRAGSP